MAYPTGIEVQSNRPYRGQFFDRGGGMVNAQAYGLDPSMTDCGPLIQELLETHGTLFIPKGTYWIRTPIVIPTQSKLYGESGQYFNAAKTLFRSNVADLGEGVAMVILNEDDDTNVQDIHIENIMFRGDGTVSGSNLSAAVDSGVIGIDVTHVKDHVMIRNCSFRALKRAIATRSGQEDYTAQIYLDNIHISNCYRAIEVNTTTPLSILNSDIRECYDWIDAIRVSILNCTFNNSSFGQDRCSIQAEVISCIGSWFEAGNNYLDISGHTDGKIFATGNIFGAAQGSSGGVKHNTRFGDNACIVLIGNESAVNNRIGHGAAVTDWSTVSIQLFGNEFPTYDWDQSGTDPRNEGAGFLSFDKTRREVANFSGFFQTRLHLTNYVAQEFGPVNSLNAQSSYVLTFPSAGTGARYWIKLHLSGTNNGAGGATAYYDEYVITKAHGNTWSAIRIGGTDSWTISITNVSATSITVEITEDHEGDGVQDRATWGDRNFNVTIV